MTISNQDARTGPYSGNGSTTSFAYDFKVIDEDHLVVTLKNSSNVETVQTITTHYTVTGVGNSGGGSVEMVTAPASGETLTISRAVPLTQEVDLVNRGGVQPEVLETAYDKLTQALQDQAELFARIPRFPVSSSLTDVELPLTLTAGAALRVNSTADGFENGPTADQITSAQSYAEAAQAALDEFTDLYLGAKASDPTLDNDGNALQDGALYFDTTNNVMKVYDLGTTTWKRTTPTSGDQANIDTVSGIAANVTTVAGISANVTTVAGVSADVTTVAGISADVTTVAADGTDIGTVAGISADVTTVAGISADVTTVAADGTDIGTVAGISGNVTTVAGVAANVTTVAGVAADVTTVAGISADVTTAATNVADITNFADVYIGPSASDPTQRADTSALQAGDLYFNTTSNVMRVYTGSAWVDSAVDVTNLSPGVIISGSSSGNALRITQTGTGNALVVEDSANPDSTPVVVTSSGYVGVGIATPLTPLHVRGNWVNGEGTLQIDANSGQTYSGLTIQNNGTTKAYLYHENTGDDVWFSTNGTAQDLIFASSPTSKERMRIVGSDGGVKVVNAAYNPPTTDNDLSFDLSATNNFKCTPSGTGTLTFTNHTAGQSGNILLINTGGHAISLAATTKGDANLATTISTAGTYWLSYYDDGTNAYVVTSAALV